MPFKIDCASLIVQRRFTVFALFYFVFEGNFQVQAPGGGGGGLYLEGQFNGEFFTLRVWGAYTWRGLFSEFYGLPPTYEGLFYFLMFLLCLNSSISLLKFKV